MNRFISVLGDFGPRILIILSILLFLPDLVMAIFVFIGFRIVAYINGLIKNVIKEKRPTSNYTDYSWSGKKTVYPANSLGRHNYGMPSSHALESWFLTTFIYLAFKNIPVTLLFLLVSIITCVQRVVDNNHTVKQVIVGSTLGIIFAYSYFQLLIKFYCKARK